MVLVLILILIQVLFWKARVSDTVEKRTVVADHRLSAKWVN